MLHRVDPTTVEIGTENWFRAGTGNQLMTAALRTSLENLPDAAIQIAIDLENSRPLIDEAVEMARENADGMTAGMVDLITKANNVRLTVDFSGENLLTVAASGRDEESATQLREGIDGLLALAKMGGQAAVTQLKEEDEESSKVVQSILNSLKASQDGSDVAITIPKPEGFEGAVERMSRMGGMR
jgi:hypothetical protein